MPTTGGYTLTKLKEAGGEETRRFEGTLTHNGTPIAHVANSGTGGSNHYYPLTPGPAGKDALSALHDYARTWNTDSLYAGIEDTDALVDHLVEVALLNRRRVHVVLLDDQDYFTDGLHYQISPAVPRDVLLNDLRSPQYAGRNPRIWDKTTSTFIPVT